MCCRVLDRHRKPLGYLDVPALKKKWEAGEADPVCPHYSSHLRLRTDLTSSNCRSLCTERESDYLHDQVRTQRHPAIYRYYSLDTARRARNVPRRESLCVRCVAVSIYPVLLLLRTVKLNILCWDQSRTRAGSLSSVSPHEKISRYISSYIPSYLRLPANLASSITIYDSSPRSTHTHTPPDLRHEAWNLMMNTHSQYLLQYL